jgi:hypothetical protein
MNNMFGRNTSYSSGSYGSNSNNYGGNYSYSNNMTGSNINRQPPIGSSRVKSY